MNVVLPLSPASPGAPPAEAAFAAGVARGVALIGVLAGFTRRVFGLGRAAARVVVRLEQEGADPYSADTGFDIKSAVGLLQRALHLADALRARLCTPAVLLALLRPRAARCDARIARPAADKAGEMPLQLWQISYLRADEATRAAYRDAIAEMSDGEVIAHIHDHLICASAMLGDTREAAGIAVLGQKAAELLAAVDADVVSDTVVSDDGAPDDGVPDDGAPDEGAPRQADLVMADADADSGFAPPDRIPRPAVGRGPPF